MDLKDGETKRNQNPWLYHETMPSSGWFSLALVFTLLSIFLFYKIHWKGISLRHLAYFNLILSAITMVPFLAYSWTGVAWTGTSLTSFHRIMINSRHAVLMGAWSALSVIQMIAQLCGKHKIHSVLGRFVIYMLLPCIFIELHTNAVLVFLPEKPQFLASSMEGRNHTISQGGGAEPSIFTSFVYSIPMLYSLGTPMTMMQYWYASWMCLQQRKFRLHAIYMALLIASAYNAGVLRWFVRHIFHQSKCPWHTENETTIVVQQLSQNFGAVLLLMVITALYTLMTPTERQDRKARFTYYWYLSHVMISLVGSACLDVPFAISCREDESLLIMQSASPAEL